MQTLELQPPKSTQSTTFMAALFNTVLRLFRRNESNNERMQSKFIQEFWESNHNLYASTVLREAYYRMGAVQFLQHYIAELDNEDTSLKIKAVIQSTIAPIYKMVTGMEYDQFKTYSA